MPLYDFHCRACSHDFEALVRPQDHEATRCPSCQSVDLERLLSSFAVSTAEKTQAAAAQSRKRQVNANKEKLVADEEYRKEHEGH
jgi:putative FmdB family regulatory protein